MVLVVESRNVGAFLANQPTFITPLKKAQFHRPPWMTEGSGTELLIVWFQLLTSLPARKWSHCLFGGVGGGGAGEACVIRDWEGL